MRLDTTQIVVGKRVRENVDEGIEVLARSIEELGQLQPIVIDRDCNLIAGARRLRACEILKRQVDAVIVETAGEARLSLKAERDENTCRVAFTPEEAVEIGLLIEALEKPRAAARQRAGKNGSSGGRGKKKPAGNLPTAVESTGPTGPTGRVSEIAAEAAGMKRKTYEKAKAVVKAAEADPSLRPTIDEMNRTGNVDRAYRHVKGGAPSTTKKFNIEDDARKFLKLRDSLCGQWTSQAHRDVMRKTFKQLAKEV